MSNNNNNRPNDNPFPVTTALVKGAFRFAGALSTEFRQQQQQPQPQQPQQQQAQYQQHHSPQKQHQQHQQQPYQQGVVVGVQPPVYVANAQPQPTTVIVVQQQQPPQHLYDEGPTIFGTAFGFNYSVGKSFDMALTAQRTNLPPNTSPDHFSNRINQALTTPLCCLPLMLFLFIERFLISLVTLPVILFPNMLLAIILVPQSVFHFTNSVVCKSPRVSVPLKVVSLFCFPLVIFAGVFGVCVVSLFFGLAAGFAACPYPWSLAWDTTAVFWENALRWRIQAYRALESAEGEFYSLSCLVCLCIPIFPILGALFGMVSFFGISILEGPRLWYSLTFLCLRPNNPCYVPCIIPLAVGIAFYVLFLIFVSPFVGLVACFSAAIDSAINRPLGFFTDQYSTIHGYWQFIDSQCKHSAASRAAATQRGM